MIKIKNFLIILFATLSTFPVNGMEENKEHIETNQDIINSCINHKDSDFIKNIIKRANNVSDELSPFFNHNLLVAVLNNKEEIAQEAIAEGADVNATIEPKLDMLKAACVLGRFEIIKLLLNSRANIDAKNACGSTAIMYAAIAGHFNIVKLLYDYGADITITDKDGDTAVTSAGMANYKEIEEFLSEKINNIDQKIKDDERTFLLSAKREDSVQLKEFLRQKNVDINCKDKCGWTALMYATANNRIENVRLLLEAGIKNINDQNEKGSTALIYATKEINPEIVFLLCHYNAEVNVFDFSVDFGPLITYPIRHFLKDPQKYFEIIKILVSYGAKISDTLVKFSKRHAPLNVTLFLENDAFKLQIIHKDSVVKKVLKQKMLDSTTLPETLTELILDYHISYDLAKTEIDKFFYGEDYCPFEELEQEEVWV